eukprot:GHVS01061029.1.p1 GENE.GHVS01061029.1~~GHVS01061029.1.p1  ORF type:complete len:297 (-),score=61.12 GHVS01061029.1:1194-2084(-)
MRPVLRLSSGWYSCCSLSLPPTCPTPISSLLLSHPTPPPQHPTTQPSSDSSICGSSCNWASSSASSSPSRPTTVCNFSRPMTAAAMSRETGEGWLQRVTEHPPPQDSSSSSSLIDKVTFIQKVWRGTSFRKCHQTSHHLLTLQLLNIPWTTFQPAAQLLDSPPILPSTQQTPPQSPKEPRQPPPPPSLLNHPPLPPPACVTLTATTDDQLLLTAAQQHYANKPTDPPPLRHVDYPITANMRLCAEAYVCVCWYKVAQTFIRLCNDAPDLRVLCCHHLIDSRHHHPACCLVTYPHQL